MNLYEPNADEMMTQTTDFKQWLESNGFEYDPAMLEVVDDQYFLHRDDERIEVFGRVDSDKWTLIEKIDCESKSDAIEWFRGFMSSKRHPEELIEEYE